MGVGQRGQFRNQSKPPEPGIRHRQIEVSSTAVDSGNTLGGRQRHNCKHGKIRERELPKEQGLRILVDMKRFTMVPADMNPAGQNP